MFFFEGEREGGEKEDKEWEKQIFFFFFFFLTPFCRRVYKKGPSVIKPKTKHIDHGDDKRGITYDIHKNKGLTVERKKEDRNPRVKLRKKFTKAKKRRKGQVREVFAVSDLLLFFGFWFLVFVFCFLFFVFFVFCLFFSQPKKTNRSLFFFL